MMDGWNNRLKQNPTKNSKLNDFITMSDLSFFVYDYLLINVNAILIKIQEKQNNITTKEKREKKIRAKRKENKENITPSNEVRESKKEKETRIQKGASSRVDRWIRSGDKEGWLRFKTNQVILIQAGSSLSSTRSQKFVCTNLNSYERNSCCSRSHLGTNRQPSES